jgi:hypothetical protein
LDSLKSKLQANMMMLSVAPYPDIVQAFAAQRIAIAEKADQKVITVAEADAQIAQARSSSLAEIQRRSLASRAVAAQEQSAAAAAAAPGPFTCTSFGNTTTCF